MLLETALAYAERRIPVFPLRPGEKIPFDGSQGFKDATTNAERIREWWGNCPSANIGIPTGERSGLLVIDVDHQAGLEALEAEHGEMPATRTHGTGSGGMHYLYRYPAGSGIRSSAGRLAEHVDVRGEGGYIVAPGSRTTGPYEVLDRRPLAAPPAWLLEAASAPMRPPGAAGKAPWGAKPCRRSEAPPLVSAELDGPKIPEGTRDDALARIAGRLHDGSRDLDGLVRELTGINAARCVPPLPETQVEKVARSIHARTPCRKGASEEALVALAGIEEKSLKRRSWIGVGGKSARRAFEAAIEEARRHGTLIPGGVLFSIGVRPWALAAGVSSRSMLDYWRDGEKRPGIISRLKRRGILRSAGAGRNGETGSYVLVFPEAERDAMRAKFHHSSTGTVGGVVKPGAPPLRWGVSSRGPGLRGTVRNTRRVRESVAEGPRAGVGRMGKCCEAVVYFLLAAGGTMHTDDLYGRINPHKDPEDRKRWRPRDLRRREIARLVAAGVVECPGKVASLAEDWLDAYNLERERAGEIEAHNRDMKRYQRERDAYREHLERRKGGIGSDRHPANAGADGWVEELRPESAGEVLEASERDEAPVSGLAAAVCDYLELNPGDACQWPSWLANCLWSEELVIGKPTAAAVVAAIEELGGDPYLRLLLETAREAGAA